MMSEFSVAGGLVALFLPWLLGAVWVFCLLRLSGRWNLPLVVGYGFFLGLFLVTLLIRGWSLAALPFNYWGMALALLLLIVPAVLLARYQAAPGNRAPDSPPLRGWLLAITVLLLSLIALRYATLAQELLLRPLFLWDAWMNWSPKPTVWFHHQELVPFVSKEAWLARGDDTMVYTAGASNAWRYPPGIPLILLWNMLGFGVSDHTVLYLPWLLAPLALGLVLFGHLALSGAPLPVAVLACYALLNLPFMNAHVALPGYADVWVAAVFGCAVFALQEWDSHRRWPYGLLALVFALMCTQLKIPGVIMGGIVMVLFLLALARVGVKAILAALVLLALLAGYAFTVGIDFSLPAVGGRVVLSAEVIQLPFIGIYEIAFHPVQEAMLTAIFLMLNWNLLWFLFLGTLLARLISGRRFTRPSVTLQAIVVAALFIGFVYFMTNRYQFALDFTQVNRALVYLVPPLVYYVFRSWLEMTASGNKR